jgi:hypothetical protein
VKAPDVLEEVAIEATIKGLRIGPFAAHLAGEKPTNMQDLYSKFEKYYRSDNDLRRTRTNSNREATETHRETTEIKVNSINSRAKASKSLI